jgi:hypothetical protein
MDPMAPTPNPQPRYDNDPDVTPRQARRDERANTKRTRRWERERAAGAHLSNSVGGSGPEPAPEDIRIVGDRIHYRDSRGNFPGETED